MHRHTADNTAAELLAQLMPQVTGVALGEWTRQASCVEIDPESFFPPKGDPGIKAKQVCAQCSVRDDCLAYAIEADEKSGIWGGLNAAERQSLKRRRKRAQAAASAPVEGTA